MALEEEGTLAAGGLIFEAGAARRVLVVHRPRYDDWAFPKGKGRPGESLSDVALREVEEETGLTCRIVREVGETRYPVRTAGGGRAIKVVVYYLMEPAGGAPRADGVEVDQVEWWSPEEAARRLSYEHDRRLLADLLSQTTG